MVIVQIYLRMLVWSDFSRTFTTKRFTERITCCPSSRSSIRESSIKVMRPCIRSFKTPVEASRARLSIWNSYPMIILLERCETQHTQWGRETWVAQSNKQLYCIYKNSRGRWEGGSRWGTHVNPWLIYVNVWQKPLQYCKVVSLQLIKINGKKNSEY